MNMHWHPHVFELPAPQQGERWHVFANTALAPPEDIWPVGSEPLLADQNQCLVGDRSVVVLVGKKNNP
jgi:glycogen operon protein